MKRGIILLFVFGILIFFISNVSADCTDIVNCELNVGVNCPTSIPYNEGKICPVLGQTSFLKELYVPYFFDTTFCYPEGGSCPSRNCGSDEITCDASLACIRNNYNCYNLSFYQKIDSPPIGTNPYRCEYDYCGIQNVICAYNYGPDNTIDYSTNPLGWGWWVQGDNLIQESNPNLENSFPISVVGCNDTYDNDCDGLGDCLDPDCFADLITCSPPPNCGDGYVNISEGEQCEGEGTAPVGWGCSDFGFTGGTLSCTGCKINTNGCNNGIDGYCGDDSINHPGEQCDGNTIPSGVDCQDFDSSFSAGSLTCSNCMLDTTGCGKCDLTNADWNQTTATEGDVVEMTLDGTGCTSSDEIWFFVFENTTGNPVSRAALGTFGFDNSPLTITWTTTYNNSMRGSGSSTDFFFVGWISGSGEMEYSNTLYVDEGSGPPPFCSGISICGHYSDSTNCTDDLCVVAGNTYDEGDCTLTERCAWDTDTTSCVLENISRCVSPGDTESIDIGICSYNESSFDDDCDDGYLTYSWGATWEWDEDNTFPGNDQPACDDIGEGYVYDSGESCCHYDPNSDEVSCAPGSNTVPCPAQVKLGFFGIYQLIITVSLIFGIYFISRKRYNI